MTRILRFPLRRANLRLHTLDSFRFGPFRYFWAAGFLTSGAMLLQQVVVGWLTYDVTQSPLLTVLAMGLAALPNLLVAPFGGVLADRWDRAKLLAGAYAYNGIVTAGFSAAVMFGRIETWQIFVFILAMGLSQSIWHPTRLALVPRIVPREYLINAFAVSMLTSSGARMAVPAAAGLLIVLLGPGRTLLIGAMMYLAAAVALGSISVGQAAQRRAGPGSVVRDFVDGARYVRREPVLLAVILLGAAAYTLLVPTVHGLLPVYASEVFDVGPAGLGLMMSSFGLGAAVGTFVLASLGEVRYKGRVILGCMAVMAAAALAFSRSPTLVIALPLLMLYNGGFDTFAAVRSATIQAVAPDRLRGRVAALNTMGSGLFALGSLVLGWVAEVLGAPPATLIAGFVMAACLTAISLRFRQLWSFR